MLEIIGFASASIYSAFSIFAVTVMALAPILPAQASLAISSVFAIVAAAVGWRIARALKRL